jgi:hypothetical protein
LLLLLSSLLLLPLLLLLLLLLLPLLLLSLPLSVLVLVVQGSESLMDHHGQLVVPQIAIQLLEASLAYTLCVL